MIIQSKYIDINTKGYPEIVNLNGQIIEFLTESEIKDGLLTVFVPGSTAAITTIEYEPGLLKDLPELWNKIAPKDAKYQHDATWHDGNGYAHILAALYKPSLTIPIADGQPTLGTWQQVVLLDFDNRARKRNVVLQVIGQ